MNEVYCKTIYELIQNLGYISKLILMSELAMNDGELQMSQKYTKELQSMLKTSINDVFEEFFELVRNKNNEINDYDLPSTLELAKQISNFQFDAGVMLLLLNDNYNDKVFNISESKLIKDLNSIKQIYQEIYGN